MDTNDTPELFYDRNELLDAMAAPEYAKSPRYRDQVSEKLNRSLHVGTLTPMGERIDPSQLTHTRNVYDPDANANGYTVRGPFPEMVEALRVNTGFFHTPEQIADAMSAPQFEIDLSYRRALKDKIDRSVREGRITPDLQAVTPTAPAR
jgi:hypothetical protein